VVISETLALGTTNTTAFAGDRGLALETLTDNIVDGDQALALKDQVIRNTAVGTIPLVVNSIASTTANLTEFQVNGTKVLEVTPAGGLRQNGLRLFSQPVDNTNTFFGINSGGTSTTGTGNDAFGNGALNVLTTGNANTAIGHASLSNNIVGGQNVMVGTYAGSSITGSSNTSIGYNSSSSITTGQQNTFLGHTAGTHASQLATATNSTGVGFNSFTDKSNQMVFGNASVTEFKFDRNAGATLLAPRIENVSTTSNLLTLSTSSVDTMTENLRIFSNTTGGTLSDGFGSSLNFGITLFIGILNSYRQRTNSKSNTVNSQLYLLLVNKIVAINI
jgi:hypothetical protein